MPSKRANRVSQPTEAVAPRETRDYETTDTDSLERHFEFLREFQRLKAREDMIDYSGALWQLSSLEPLRMNLRFNEDAKRFVRLNLSQEDIKALKQVYGHQTDSAANQPRIITTALNMIHHSNVSSIDEALGYYCRLHELRKMIDTIPGQDAKREFTRFHHWFAHAFDVRTGSN